MTNNFYDLITRMANELDEYQRMLLDDCTVTHRLSNEARAALADEPAVPQDREPASVTGQPSDQEGPSAEDVEELCEEHCFNVEGYESLECLQGLINKAIARWGNEVAELVAWLRERATWCTAEDPARKKYDRAAELLQRQVLVPVAVDKRPWEREGWCDPDGLCWLGSDALDGCTPTWLYGSPAWAERFPNVHRVLLPAHALPLPEVGE